MGLRELEDGLLVEFVDLAGLPEFKAQLPIFLK